MATEAQSQTASRAVISAAVDRARVSPAGRGELRRADLGADGKHHGP